LAAPLLTGLSIGSPKSRRSTLTHSYTCIGTVRQAGTRRYDEALANLRLMARAPAMLRLLQAVAHVLDMSDPDHDAFVDSAADCLDALLAQQEPLRTLLSEFRTGQVPVGSQ
jgi:hypothetical protein